MCQFQWSALSIWGSIHKTIIGWLLKKIKDSLYETQTFKYKHYWCASSIDNHCQFGTADIHQTIIGWLLKKIKDSLHCMKLNYSHKYYRLSYWCASSIDNHCQFGSADIHQTIIGWLLKKIKDYLMKLNIQIYRLIVMVRQFQW